MALNIGTHPRSRKKIRLHRRRHVSVESYAEHTCENVPVSRLPSCFCVMSRRGLLPSTPRARVVDPVLLQPPFAQKCSSIVGPPLLTQPVSRIPTYPAPLFASTNRTFSFSSSSSSSSSLSPSSHSLPLPPPFVLPFPTLPSFRLSSSVRKYLQSLAFPYATFLVLSVSSRSIVNVVSTIESSLFFMGKLFFMGRLSVKLNFNQKYIGQQRLFDRYLSFHREQAPAFIERYYCWIVPSLPHSVIRVIVHAVLIRTCENEYIFFLEEYFYFSFQNIYAQIEYLTTNYLSEN